MAISARPATVPALPVGQAGPPLLRVVSPQGLTEHIRQQDAYAARVAQPEQEVQMDELAKHIRTDWDIMRNHRNSGSGWGERLLKAQRMFNGEYDAEQLAAIKEFGGSEVYARVVALKCRGATSLLREVYLSSNERAWG